MSGVETAASVAFQLSSEVNSARESGILDVDKYSVIHIVQKPIWVMPLFFPSNPDLVPADTSAPVCPPRPLLSTNVFEKSELISNRKRKNGHQRFYLLI